jgi:multidrug efflux pump
MNISAPFIKRPIGTSLLTLALLISGVLAFTRLPVAPLPQVEFPVIQVSASLPGASPETMASAVATPLERQFGRIAGINQMTSVSQLGSTGIDQCGAQPIAVVSSRQSLVSQSKSGGGSDFDHVDDLRQRDPARYLRSGQFHPVAETGAGEWGGPSVRWRRS